MTANKVIVLADVDGQFNDFDTKKFDHLTGERLDGHLTYFMANEYVVRYDETVLKRVVALHDAGVFEVQWLTTWGADANEYLRREFGFSEDLFVADEEIRKHREDLLIGSIIDDEYRPWRNYGSWWKSDVARELYMSDDTVRIVWLDDELGVAHPGLGIHAKDLGWLRSADPDRILAISTWPALSHRDVDLIEEWIER